MYKILMLLLVLSLSAALVEAQANSQSEPSQSTAGASGYTIFEGCLSGSDGNYTLTADNGSVYQLAGNIAELKDDVGHEIQITGLTTTAGHGSQGSEGAQQTTLEVKSVKHISTTCKSAARR